jgi:hypothetical protein
VWGGGRTGEFSTSSLATLVREANGLSRIMHAIDGSVAPYMIDVAAPILRKRFVNYFNNYINK